MDMKRISLVIGLFVMGYLGMLAQVSTENMSAHDCAKYGRQLFDAGLYSQAFPYIKKAAERGYKDAHLMAGWMFCNGKGVEQNYGVAMREYNNGAMKGEASCFNNMGWMYENGLGVEKNPQVAFNLYKTAADKGSEIGKENLARCYEYGIGVKVDLHEARRYYKTDSGGSRRCMHKIDKKNLDSARLSTQVGLRFPDIDFGTCENFVNQEYSYNYVPEFGVSVIAPRNLKFSDLNKYSKVGECFLVVFNHQPMGDKELEVVQHFYNGYSKAKIKVCKSREEWKSTYTTTVSPFVKIIEVSKEVRNFEKRSWPLFDDYHSYTCKKFGVGDYYEYGNDGKKIQEVKWEDFAIIVDKNQEILWRGRLFENDGLTDVVINPAIVAIFDEKHNKGIAETAKMAVANYDVIKDGFPPVYISSFSKDGKYEMKLYGEPEFFPSKYRYKYSLQENYTSELDISLTRADFAESQLNSMKKKAYEQFETATPCVYRISLGWSSKPVYSGKNMVYNSQTCTWTSTDIGRKFDYSYEYDLAKRYKKSPIIRNRLYFLSKNSAFSSTLQGEDEEKDIITVRVCPTKELLRDFLEKYPQSKYYDMLLEMYRFHKDADYNKD